MTTEQEPDNNALADAAVDRIVEPVTDAIREALDRGGPELLLAFLERRVRLMVSRDAVEVIALAPPPSN